MNQRIFVEKKEQFQTAAKALKVELKKSLGVESLKTLKIIQVYDVLNVDEDILKMAKESLFKDIATDILYDKFDYDNVNYFCVEQVPGQFDQKADSMIRSLICLRECAFEDDSVTSKGKLYYDENGDLTLDLTGDDCFINYEDYIPYVKTALLYIVNDDINPADKEEIIRYLVNPLECQLKDLSAPIEFEIDTNVLPVITVDNFIRFSNEELASFIKERGLAMNMADIMHIQDYFKSINRNPTITEVLVLDTYWSDHCRHTTFETHLENIDFSGSNIKDELEEAFKVYKDLRKATNREDKPMTLMDMASIEARFQKQTGLLDDLEESEEVNACSIEIDVDVNGIDERYLLMFKNETHNHPTEIEPFGGASTCVGGAIRDPLSGRAYVFQALRITGSGDVTMPVKETRPGKLPQRVIGQRAAAGNSSYGNQIGLAATYLREVYHPGYVAKRMELGAVVGAVKKADVVRESPKPGDIVVMLGAPTGRDGVGGATGSSKTQDNKALVEMAAEVQKGNAPEERKIQRLFRNPELTKLIKKSNDFGAGGVSVAIGELADGLSVDLDAVPTKYPGLNGTDLALSESQERMACVIDEKNFNIFDDLCVEENLRCVKVADVTNRDKLEMTWRDQKIIDIDRAFLDTNGIPHKISPIIESLGEENPFDGSKFVKDDSLKASLESLVGQLNYASNQSLASIFDNTTGRTTVLTGFGGKYQATQSKVSVQKIPVLDGETNTVSMMAHGFNPEMGLYEPFYAGAYSIIEAVASLIAAGATWNKARLSLQEYFERVTDKPERFGKPVAALLGALYAQRQLELPALGGKDSMSGSFEELHVPPTIVSFAITTSKVDKIISSEFKATGENVYILLPTKSEKVDYNKLRANFNLMNKLQDEYDVTACSSIGDGGIAYALANMSYGNNIGVEISEQMDLEDLFYPYYGGFVFTTMEDIVDDNIILIGETIEDVIAYNDERINIKELLTLSQSVLADVYPTIYTHQEGQVSKSFSFESLEAIKHAANSRDNLNSTSEGEGASKDKGKINHTTYTYEAVTEPTVYIPVFMGTNSEYDLKKAFEKAGATTEILPFVDLHPWDIEYSIEEMVYFLENCHIFALGGSFSSEDDSAGTSKFILNILLDDRVKEAINGLISREGLIIGIGNGFKLLVDSGLLPYGQIGKVSEDMATISLNERGMYVDKIVQTKINPSNSPWLSQVMENEVYQIAISHGEGRFIADKDTLEKLFESNQVVSQYVDFEGNPSMDFRFNPAGSFAAIEGITSPDGRIIGKMGHAERYEDGNYQNIIGNKELKLFESAVAYFRKK